MTLLRRVWAPGRFRRPPTVVEALRRADAYRRQGRYPEAVAMVTHGLALEPNSLTGHLLAAYLHAASRTMAAAKAEFAWVLARDPGHARALLGLARIALEEGDAVTCREFLVRALRFYPDFPEAQALLDAVLARRAEPEGPAPERAPLRVDRLRLAGPSRSLLVLRPDGAVLAARPAAPVVSAAGVHLVHALHLGTATLARAGFGALRRAVVEDARDAVFVRLTGEIVLALALPRTTEVTQGLLDVNCALAWAQHELGLAATPTPAPARATPPPAAADRRVS